MEMLEKLLDDHVRLRKIGVELQALVDRDTPCELAPLADCRWRLARLILRHLPIEDRHVYKRLAAHPDKNAAERVRRSRLQLDGIYGEFQAHSEKWTPDRIVAEWPEYRDRVHLLVRRLMVRLDREEAELYPLLDGVPETPPERSPDDRNWAADAWAIRAKIAGE